MLKYIIIYLSAMSLLTFILFGADKHKARAHKWRIPEKTLLGLSLLGGFTGGFLGMEFFRLLFSDIRTVLFLSLWLITITNILTMSIVRTMTTMKNMRTMTKKTMTRKKRKKRMKP